MTRARRFVSVAMTIVAVATADVAVAAMDTAPASAAATKRKPGRRAQPKPASPAGAGAKPHRPRRKRAPAAGRGGRPAVGAAVEITPFPSHAAAAREALAQNRRDQIDDAEKAARGGDRQKAPPEDRWQSVLFALHDIDVRNDPEACFWSAIAYYRLGDIRRARIVRGTCQMPAADNVTLDGEEVTAAGLQPPTALQEIDTPEAKPALVVNPGSYTGAAPTRAR